MLDGICSSNHMLGRATWDKLPECILKILNFSKITRFVYPKNHPDQTCGFWLITPYQQTLRKQNKWTLCTETNYLLTAGNYKLASGQLHNCWQSQNNSVNGTLPITINRMITLKINSQVFLSTWVFFDKYSQFTGQQGKGKAISFSPSHLLDLQHGHLKNQLAWGMLYIRHQRVFADVNKYDF